MKKKENLPYRVFELACTMFLHKFTHNGMEAFFCNQMNRHPSEIGIPQGMNRETKFKWLLGQLEVAEQRRVLEELSQADDPQVRPEDIQKLHQMLGASPIQIPVAAPGRLDTKFISEAWQKALDRRHEDPEGAITAARTLLETVCKHILDECGVEYGDGTDLPKLYGLTSKELNLAPSQHTADAFKKILGGVHSVVDGLANLRNRLGDAHGQGKRPVKPLPRHAELAVNMAGSVASFLLATFEAKSLSAGRLQLSTIGSSVNVPSGNGYSATLMSVRNTEGRFENTCYNVRAELKFVYPHTGAVLKVPGLFVTSDGQSIKAEPQTTASLGMTQSAQFALLVRNEVDKGFCTLTSWPFDPDAEKKLTFGEWQLYIRVTSDEGEDRATADYIVQLYPNLSSSWIPGKDSARTRGR
jgi:hypothetical protein